VIELLAASSLSGLLAAAVSPVALAVGALLGYRFGLFLATVIGLVLLAGFLAALALAPAGAAFLQSFDCPPAHALAASFCVVFGLAAAACRFGIGEVVQEDDVRFRGAIDKVGGLVVGGFVGGLVAGAILVGWSMWDLPRGLKADATAMKMDAGARLLRTFARCLHSDPQARARLLDGDLERGGRDEGLLVSEPFDDADGNWQHDGKEPYLDLDGSGSFTSAAPVVEPAAGSGPRRTVGLLEAYWLGAWRTARVLSTPRLTTPARVEADTRGAGRPLCRITAADADADDGDTLTFGIIPREGDDAKLVEIDPATGEVTLHESEVGTERQTVRFTVKVTDRSGLAVTQEIIVALPAESRPSNAEGDSAG
jgi:hypothetical protein